MLAVGKISEQVGLGSVSQMQRASSYMMWRLRMVADRVLIALVRWCCCTPVWHSVLSFTGNNIYSIVLSKSFVSCQIFSVY